MSSSENISRFDQMSVEDAAAFWLVQRDQCLMLDDDRRFAAWLCASPNHVRAWNKAVSLWKGFENSTDPLLEAMRHDALTTRRPSGNAWKFGAVAASLAILLVGGVMGWRFYEAGSGGVIPAIPRHARPTFVAGGDGPATFALPDGSQVTLNADAAIAVRYRAERRAVRLLGGRAFFRVIHDTARPFTIDAGNRVISDPGADFDVLLSGRALSVTLVSGSIAVATGPHGEKGALRPGQTLEIMPGQPDRILAADMEEAAAWRTVYVEFHDEPLESALAQINRYGGAPARLADLSSRGIRVSGRFRTGDPSRFATALARIYPLRIVQRPDGAMDITTR